MVWKDTTKLGCAIQRREQETYVVARYSPPGNVIGTGTFAKNVGRKVHVDITVMNSVILAKV